MMIDVCIKMKAYNLNYQFFCLHISHDLFNVHVRALIHMCMQMNEDHDKYPYDHY